MNNKNNEQNKKKSNESFIRWQGRSVEQMGFLNNLLTGLSTGLLAFQINFAFSKEFALHRAEMSIFVVSLAFGFLSLIFGVYLAWNRLSSFGKTARIARKRETKKRKRIEELREYVKDLDNRTWVLLKLQVASFGLEIASLAILLAMHILFSGLMTWQT